MTKVEKILLFLEKNGIIKKLNPGLIEFYNSILVDDSFPEESFKNDLIQLNNWVYENYYYEVDNFENNKIVQKIVTIIKNLINNSTIEKNNYKLQIKIVMEFKNEDLEPQILNDKILSFINNLKQKNLNDQQIPNSEQNNNNNYQQILNYGQNNNMYSNEASKYSDEIINLQNLRGYANYAPPYFVGMGTRFAAWITGSILWVTVIAPILSLIFLFLYSTTVPGKMFGYKYVKRDTGENLTVIELLLYYLTTVVVAFICVFTLGIFWIIDIVTIRSKNGTYAEKWAGIKKVSVR